jgi:hypothetical protein
LEQFVCDRLRRQRTLDHTERVLAILQAQRRHYRRQQRQRKQYYQDEKELKKSLHAFQSEKEAEELAIISRQYSHCSIEMAKVMGIADAFAVSVDDQKCNQITWMQDQVVSKGEDKPESTSASKKMLPRVTPESSYSIMSLTTSGAA